MNRFMIMVEGLPPGCGDCGRAVTTWRIAPYGQRMVLQCPHCHTRLGPLDAIRAEPGAIADARATRDHMAAWAAGQDTHPGEAP